MTQGLVIVDGDDTLWKTAHLYTEARHECMRLAKAHGLNPRAFLQRQIEIDSQLVPVFHFSREHFPTACREAYRTLATEAGYTIDEGVAQEFYDAAASVFARPSQVYRGTETALRRLRKAGFRVVLLTKGDAEVQAKRIIDSGLGRHIDQVVIVGSKTEVMFRSICDWAGVAPSQAYSIGNSIRSDIAPAVKSGMRGIHLPHDTWAYEEGVALPAGAVTLRSLRQAVAAIERQMALEASSRPGLAA